MASIQIVETDDDASSVDTDAVEMMNSETFRALGYYLESKDGTSAAEHLEKMREEQAVLIALIRQLVDLLSKR